MKKPRKEKSIRITCQGAATIAIDKLLLLQGNLKELSDQNHGKLRASILKHGITFPFLIWKNKGKHWILDATQRDKVLRRLAEEGYDVPPVPVVWIEAADEKEAKEKILLCNSQYGEMTDASLGEFIKTALLDLEQLKEITTGLDLIESELTKPVIKPLEIKSPPKMAWALIGIPIQNFSAVQSLLDKLPKSAQVHTTANDQDRQS